MAACEVVPSKRWDDGGRRKTQGSLLLHHRMRKQRGTGQTCCIRGAVSGAGQRAGADSSWGGMSTEGQRQLCSSPFILQMREGEVLLANCAV